VATALPHQKFVNCQLTAQKFIRKRSIWYAKYAVFDDESFGGLKISIALKIIENQPKKPVFWPKIGQISKRLTEF
jgi:hypothetical protein